MKKSTAYKLAQHALLTSSAVSGSEKLEVLRVLMEAEDLALFCEKQEEQEKES
jgi:hypothetical protein